MLIFLISGSCWGVCICQIKCFEVFPSWAELIGTLSLPTYVLLACWFSSAPLLLPDIIRNIFCVVEFLFLFVSNTKQNKSRVYQNPCTFVLLMMFYLLLWNLPLILTVFMATLVPPLLQHLLSNSQTSYSGPNSDSYRILTPPCQCIFFIRPVRAHFPPPKILPLCGSANVNDYRYWPRS